MTLINCPDLKKYYSLLTSKRYFPTGSAPESLLQEFMHLNRRIEDKLLHLAIVGQFSSGKSTLINSIIGEKLLKSSALATTAAETHILSGPKVAISVLLNNGSNFFADEEDFTSLIEAIRSCGVEPASLCGCEALSQSGIINTDSVTRKKVLKKLIAIFTSDSRIASQVRRCDIVLPSNLPIPNLDIIDTPGVDAGGDDTSFHEIVTKRILDKEADAVIILIPADHPCDKSLIEYLKIHLACVKERGVFVITKSDSLPHKDIEDVARFVKQTLQTQLGLDTDNICALSSYAFLPGVKEDFFEDESQAYYRKEYSSAMELIFSLLSNNRTHLITSKACELFGKLLQKLQPVLKNARKEAYEKQSIIQSHQPPTVKEAMKSVWQEAEGKMRTDLERKINFQNYCFQNGYTILLQTVWGEIKGKYIENKGAIPKGKVIGKLVQRMGKERFARLSTAACESLSESKIVGEIEVFLNSAFSRYYDIIPRAARTIKVPKPSAPKFVAPKPYNAEYEKLYKEYTDKEESKDGQVGCISLLIGLAIGSCICPGGGTIIGAIIGATIGGVIMAKRQAEHAKEMSGTIYDFVKEYVDTFKRSYFAEVADHYYSWYNSVNSTFFNNLSDLQKQYASDVESVLRRYEADRLSIQKEIQQIEADCAWLENKKKTGIEL